MSERRGLTTADDNASGLSIDWGAWPNILSMAVIIFMAALVLATFQDYGISWDEMLQNTYGKLLLKFYASGFADRSALSYVNLFLYGGFFDLSAALLNLVSPLGEYETRHLLGGTIFVAGLIGGWRLVHFLAGGRAALIAVIFLATTPLLYGHAFINPKDSPLAWLLVWVSYFVCRILAVPERASIALIAGLGLSAGLALGTRMIAIATPAFAVTALLVSIAIQRLAGPNAEPFMVTAWRQLRPFILAVPIAFVPMAVFWPWSVQSPLNIVRAFEIFSRFDWQPLVLWGGAQIPAADLPANYLTRLLSLQLPEYVLAGLAFAFTFGALSLSRERLQFVASPHGRQYIFLALSAVVPLLAFALLRPVAYNGLRHFLFVVPPLVILGAIGAERALTLFQNWRVAGALAWSVLSVGLAWQVAVMVGLHPYQYVAYNTVAGGLSGASERYELDYWGTSLGEASRGLAGLAASSTPVKAFVCGDRTSAAYFLPRRIEITDDFSAADFYIAINNPPCRDHFSTPEHAIFRVERLGVTLGFVLDLRRPHPGSGE